MTDEKTPTTDTHDDRLDPDEPIRALRSLLEAEPDLTADLERSLQLAGDRARADLREALYDVLDWPRDLAGYEAYLRGFVRWIPQQSDAEAWKNRGTDDRYAREVSDRIAHFYWLVDQRADEDDDAIVARSEGFGPWLTDFANAWGAFLDTPESFDADILDSFLRDAPEYTIEESLVGGAPNAPSGWRTFNQFFARELNAGLRPIAEPSTNALVTSPADCSYQATYAVGEDSGIPATRIKETHEYGDVRELLQGSRHADAFAGGTFVHYMLPPSAYHRFHMPVGGRVEESYVLNGKAYMEVQLQDGELASLDRSGSGYEFSQTRGIVTIDTSGSAAGDLGIVGVVPVGMSQVASVVLTTVPGTEVAKGEEFGYFQFGGSDIVLLFQEGVHPDVDTSGAFRHVGTPAIRCRTR